jgi:hypothetical protein
MMSDYQKAGRSDLAILDALSKCADAVDFTLLRELVCPREQWISNTALSFHLSSLIDIYRVVSIPGADSDVPKYRITEKGRAFLCAADAKNIFGERIENHPLKPKGAQPAAAQVTICEHHEPEAPATALLCVDEEELDNWWANLDVEAKADAWSQWSLGNDGRNSHIHIESGVPVLGTVGETAEEWNAKVERLKGADLKTQLRESVRATEAQS